MESEKAGVNGTRFDAMLRRCTIARSRRRVLQWHLQLCRQQGNWSVWHRRVLPAQQGRRSLRQRRGLRQQSRLHRLRLSL